MSKRSRTLRRAADELAGRRRPVTKVSSPADVIAMIPYLLGFEPTESLVVVALEGPRKRFGPVMRLDLVEDERDREHQADYVVGLIRGHGFGPVIVAAVTEHPERADPVVRGVLDRLHRRAIRVEDAFRADGTRWWSYVCHDPACCSPEGTPYDAASSPAAADAVLAGMPKAADRDALRAQFEPVSPARQAEIARRIELLRAESRCAPSRGVLGDTKRLIATLDQTATLSDEDIAWLAATVQDVAMRDAAWMTMTRSNAERRFARWLDVLQAVPDDLLPPVATLAGFAAWISGHGVLASHALDRVEEVRPGYSMADILRGVLDGAVNPAVWDEHVRPGLRALGGG